MYAHRNGHHHRADANAGSFGDHSHWIFFQTSSTNEPAGRAFCFILHDSPPPDQLLHLAALCDGDVCRRLAFPSHSGVLHFVNDIHPIDDLAKDDMLVVQEWRRNLKSGFSKLSVPRGRTDGELQW